MKTLLNVSALAMIGSLITFSPNTAFSQIYTVTGPDLIQYGSFENWAVTLQYWGGTYGGRPGVIQNDADGDGGLVTLIDQGPMTQTVPTIAGTTYQLTFASRAPQGSEFSGPVYPDGTPVPPWQVNVYLNGKPSGIFENDSQTTWKYFSMDFVATGSTTLGFEATLDRGWPLFDDVSLVAVPEPGTASLLALFLISGWIFKGGLTQRRRLVAAVCDRRRFPNSAGECVPRFPFSDFKERSVFASAFVRFRRDRPLRRDE